jgi:hypothetical protein
LEPQVEAARGYGKTEKEIRLMLTQMPRTTIVDWCKTFDSVDSGIPAEVQPRTLEAAANAELEDFKNTVPRTSSSFKELRWLKSQLRSHILQTTPTTAVVCQAINGYLRAIELEHRLGNWEGDEQEEAIDHAELMRQAEVFLKSQR